ncbi:hypothetical protein [Clostridium beijerinckii]|uniref:hypothetical protein n=1 Tax=Clostridium beijerinckii TaxID=1520 RepID=UPI001F4BEAC4|nr:hypothetical protein [Clostridium beijerinckii]
MVILSSIAIILVSVNLIMFEKFKKELRQTVTQCISDLTVSIDGDKLEKLIKEQSDDSVEYQDVLKSMSLAKSKSVARNFIHLKEFKGQG